MSLSVYKAPQQVIVVHPDTIEPSNTALNRPWVQNVCQYLRETSNLLAVSLFLRKDVYDILNHHPVVTEIIRICTLNRKLSVNYIFASDTFIESVREGRTEVLQQAIVEHPSIVDSNGSENEDVEYVVTGTSIGHCVSVTAFGLKRLGRSVTVPVALTNGLDSFDPRIIKAENVLQYFPHLDVAEQFEQVKEVFINARP